MVRSVRCFLPILVLALLPAAQAQVLFSESFEAYAVGTYPTGWTQNSAGESILVTSSPVAEGTHALRIKGSMNFAAEIAKSVSRSDDYRFEFHVLLPDTGLPGEMLGEVTFQNTGVKFALGSTLASAVIYVDNVADGVTVTTGAWHHVIVDVDYQTSIRRITIDGVEHRRFAANVYTWKGVVITTGSTNNATASRLLFIDSILVQAGTYALAPPAVSLSTPAPGTTNLGSPVATSWSSISSATGYHLQIGTDSTFASGVLIDDTTLTTYSRSNGIPPLLLNATHFWRVRARNANGWGDWSAVRSFGTITPPATPNPGSPSDGQSLTDLDDIYFSWSSVINVTAYHLIIAKDSNFTAVAYNDSTLTSTYRYVAFPPLEFNTRYYWKLRAIGVAGQSPWSSTRSFSTLPPPGMTLSSPSNGSTFSSSPATFSWYVSSSVGADTFRLQIAVDTSFTSLVLDTLVTSTSIGVPLTGMAPGGTYYWRVKGHNPGGWGVFSSRRSFSIVNVPVAPTLSAPSNGSQQSGFTVYLDWYLSTGSSSEYEVQVATDEAFTGIVQAFTTIETSSANVSVPPLLSATTYYWRVRARNFAGWGPWSAVRSFRTVATPPAPVLTSPPAGMNDLRGTIMIAWNSSSGKDTTHVQITTDTTGGAARVIVGKARTVGVPVSYDFFVDYYEDLYIDVTALFGNNQLIFIRLRDHNAAGYSDWTSWAPYWTQRPPSKPMPRYPVNGSAGVPFLETPFVIDANPVAHTNVKLELWPGTVAVGDPWLWLDLEESYYEEQYFCGRSGMPLNNDTYTGRYTASNDVGTEFSDYFTFQIANPVPEIHCVRDVCDDQGGYVQMQCQASQIEEGIGADITLPSSGGGEINIMSIFYGPYWDAYYEGLYGDAAVYAYTVCRLYDASSVPACRLTEINEAVSKLDPKFRTAIAEAAAGDILEPVFSLRALAEPSFLVTIKTLRDSAANREYVERYMVIAHSQVGLQYRSNTMTGYSVDNLAPRPPVGGVAVFDNGAVRVTWTANTERDLAEYRIYRSNQPGQDVRLLTPIATVMDAAFVDPSPLADAVSYYYVVARDKNENLSEAAEVAAHRVTSVAALEGIPTEFMLSQNYPNPFNPTTMIRFGVPVRSQVTMHIVNALGQLVETAAAGEYAPGWYGVTWEARVPSGTYLVRIAATAADEPGRTFTAVRKMVVLK